MGLPDFLEEVRHVPAYRRCGWVTGVLGLLLEVSGLTQPRAERAELAAGYAELQRILEETPA